MGLLDSMFGGGTNLELSLDAGQVPEGGMLSGTAVLTGGKKPLELTALKVRLLYVSVESQKDSPMPKIDTRILLDNTIAANEALPPGEVKRYAFNFTLPTGVKPSAHNVSYKVQVTADIPKVKDPSATADFKVVPAQERGFFGNAKGAAAITADELFQRWPELRSKNEDALCSAIREIMLEAYDPEKNLVAAEPLLAKLMREGATLRVREAALEAWANVLNNRARPENLRVLNELAHSRETPHELMPEVVKAAAKFADEGAMELVVELARNADPAIRKEVADQLYFAADRKVKGRKELLISMAQDQDPGVRASVFRAFAVLNNDRDVVHLVVRQAERDPSPDVQRACLGAIALAHHHGMAELVFDTYAKHVANPHVSVRKELTESLHWLPKNPKLAPIVERLLRDETEEVRKSMAWQFRNMREHPELLPLIRSVAERDASEAVRGEALAGLGSVMPVEELVPYYRARIQREPTEAVLWGVLDGARDHREVELARGLLAELARCQVARVAERAREVLANG